MIYIYFFFFLIKCLLVQEIGAFSTGPKENITLFSYTSVYPSWPHQVTGALPNGTIELSSMPEVKEEAHSDTSSLQVNQNGDDKSAMPTLEEELTSVIQAVRDLPPSLPSICFFTFLNTYQGLVFDNIPIWIWMIFFIFHFFHKSSLYTPLNSMV